MKELHLTNCVFSDVDIQSGLVQKRKLGAFIQQLIFTYTKKNSALSYNFVQDETLAQMTRDYLQHDTLTDIITFDLSEKKSTMVLADIYISIDRVKENAQSFGIKYSTELLRVIIHGALHLSGFGDKTKKEKENIRELEDIWMQKYLNNNSSNNK